MPSIFTTLCQVSTSANIPLGPVHQSNLIITILYYILGIIALIAVFGFIFSIPLLIVNIFQKNEKAMKLYAITLFISFLAFPVTFVLYAILTTIFRNF